MAAKGGKYIAVRDCMYRGRFVPSGTVIETGEGEEMKHGAFRPYDGKEDQKEKLIFDPTARLSTARKVASVVAGLPERR